MVSYKAQFALTDAIVLGLPFLKSFVTTYDYQNASVKLGLNVNAAKGTKVLPAGTDSSGLSWKTYLLITVVMIVLFIIIIYAIRYTIIRLRRKRRENEANAIAYGNEPSAGDSYQSNSYQEVS